MLMRHDERVEALLVDHLQPCHVELDARAPTPLARLEEDEAYGLVGTTHLLQGVNEFALRTVEHEEVVLAAPFLLDENEAGGPEREVVADAQADVVPEGRLFEQRLVEVVFNHLLGNVDGSRCHSRDVDFHASRLLLVASDRVVGALVAGYSLRVLLQDILHGGISLFGLLLTHGRPSFHRF